MKLIPIWLCSAQLHVYYHKTLNCFSPCPRKASLLPGDHPHCALKTTNNFFLIFILTVVYVTSFIYMLTSSVPMNVEDSIAFCFCHSSIPKSPKSQLNHKLSFKAEEYFPGYHTIKLLAVINSLPKTLTNWKLF